MRSNRWVGQEQRASEEEERFHEEDFGAQILDLFEWKVDGTRVLWGGQEPWFSESCLFDLSSDENIELPQLLFLEIGVQLCDSAPSEETLVF